MKLSHRNRIGKCVAFAILSCSALMFSLLPAFAKDRQAAEPVPPELASSQPISAGSESVHPCPHRHEVIAAETTEEEVLPAIDFEELKLRLRKTDAIGFFTKLELKGQIEDLFDDIQDFHEQDSDLSIEQLEEHFNLLLMKLLVLLQDEDEGLHRDIVQARATLWVTLADATSFFELTGT